MNFKLTIAALQPGFFVVFNFIFNAQQVVDVVVPFQQAFLFVGIDFKGFLSSCRGYLYQLFFKINLNFGVRIFFDFCK